jgi:hypothetical protein
MEFTVTFFADYDHRIPNGTVAYLADNTYPGVPADAVEIILERGLGEVVPDDILGDDEDDGSDPELVTKLKRTRMRKKWGPQ